MNSSIASDQHTLNSIREVLKSSNLPFNDLKLENNLFKLDETAMPEQREKILTPV